MEKCRQREAAKYHAHREQYKAYHREYYHRKKLERYLAFQERYIEEFKARRAREGHDPLGEQKNEGINFSTEQTSVMEEERKPTYYERNREAILEKSRKRREQKCIDNGLPLPRRYKVPPTYEDYLAFRNKEAARKRKHQKTPVTDVADSAPEDNVTIVKRKAPAKTKQAEKGDPEKK